MKRSRAWCAVLVGAALGSGALPLAAQERAVGGIGITVWTDANYRGESATFRGNVADLSAYRLSGKISSLRIAAGEYWEACEETNYGGRCQVYSGTESNLKGSSWNDRINSLRRVNYSGGGVAPPTPPSATARVILYSQPNYQGQRIAFAQSVADLASSHFSNRARSARVIGTWQLCEATQFLTCKMVNSDQPNLARMGLSAKVSSLRPASDGSVEVPIAPRLVLYGGLSMNGLSREYTSGTSNTSVPRARSAAVRGTWLVCAQPNFRPPCKEISSDMPDLLASGLPTILSARPK